MFVPEVFRSSPPWSFQKKKRKQIHTCFFLSDCGLIITFIREGVCLSVTLAFRAFCNSSGVLTKYPLPPKADIIFSYCAFGRRETGGTLQQNGKHDKRNGRIVRLTNLITLAPVLKCKMIIVLAWWIILDWKNCGSCITYKPSCVYRVPYSFLSCGDIPEQSFSLVLLLQRSQLRSRSPV